MKHIDESYGSVTSSSPTGDRFALAFADVCRLYEQREYDWVQTLENQGVSAAHPDDGWVDRVKQSVALVYPQFNHGVSVGSLIALGNADQFRLVRVIRIQRGVLGVDRFYYEALP